MTTPRVLVLGATGMLGHKLVQVLGTRCEVHATVRRGDVSELAGILDAERTLTGVPADRLDLVGHALDTVRPGVLVNCIGIVKQSDEARDPVTAITVNSLFPHRLAALCAARGIRLVHISTDCVFSGRAGGYTEDDIPDPVDLYGRTKLLGEAADGDCLTLRTSIVGRELAGAYGLLEWFLGQSGSVRGFERAIFSGLTTRALSEVLGAVICDHPDLRGLRHVASEPIDKLRLLTLFRDALGHDVEIVPDDALVIDRSLDGSRFAAETGIRIPSWPEMAVGLAADETPYGEASRC